MSYQVFIKQVGENCFQAQPLAFPDCAVVGTSREDALANVRGEIRARLAAGELVTVEVEEATEHPILRFAGIFADDPTFDDFVAEIEGYRREVDDAQGLHAEPSP
jgi:predicted RNase H-like HicB family nuclease